MTVNLRMLRRINHGEEVEAADGAVGGGLISRHGGSFKAGPPGSPNKRGVIAVRLSFPRLHDGEACDTKFIHWPV